MTETPSAQKKQILIVEDHPIFRAMLVQLIDRDLGMEVCAEADSAAAAVAAIESTPPDAAVIDLTLRDSSGLELIKDLRGRGWKFPILVLSMHEESLYAQRVLTAGAQGYISKHEAPATVVEAMRKVLNGGIYVSSSMTANLLQKLTHSGPEAKPADIDSLSDREIEVFEMIGRGMDLREIGKRLDLGYATIQTYRGRIREKLRLRNAAELYQRAALWVAERGGSAR
jgi:DNA-binding NarL/FixJ family response regulator